MPRNLYCNVLGSSRNVQSLASKTFAKCCKRLVSKVSSRSRNVQVSVLSRVFAQSLGLATSMSRLGLGLENFGREYSSAFDRISF